MTVKEPETYNDTKKNSLSFRSVRGIQNLVIYRNKQADYIFRSIPVHFPAAY